MDDQPRRILRQLTRRHGQALIDDPRRTEAFLRDLCPRHQREIFVLIQAQRRRIPQQLQQPVRGMPHAILRQRLSQQLQEELAMQAHAAEWAVDAWTHALAPGRRPVDEAWENLAQTLDWLHEKILRASRLAHRLGTTSLHVLQKGASAANRWRTRTNLRPDLTRIQSMPTRSRLWGPPRLGRIAPGLRAALALAVVALLLAGGALYATGSLSGVGSLVPGRSDHPRLDSFYPPPRSALVAEGPLFLRAEPDLDGAILDVFPPLEVVRVVGYSADGAWAQVEDGGGGWVSNRHLVYQGEPLPITGATDSRQNEAFRVQLGISAGRVTASKLNLRSGPGQHYPVIAQLTQGDAVVSIARTASPPWLQLVEPTQGWVDAAFVQPADESSQGTPDENGQG